MLNPRVFLKKFATFSVASILFLSAVGASSQSENLVQGHVTWTYLQNFDDCMSGIAGLASTRVLWFNDQVLVDNFDLGDKWVYVAETGAPDPREYVLAKSRTIMFDDPNGIWWNVTEWQYFVGASADGTKVSSVEPRGVGGVYVEGREHARAGPYYAWTVQILPEPIPDRHPGTTYTHQDYNFVVVVDTCKFLRGHGGVVEHDEETYDPDNPSEFPGRGPHEHKTFLADIRIGGQPDGGGVFVPMGQPGADYEQKGSNNGQTYSPFTP